MTNIKKILFSILVACSSLCLLPACGEFLDELPDNRAELDTEAKIYKLLVSAYSDRSFTRMCELSSDNVDDMGEDFDSWRLLEQIALWTDIIDAENESNQNIWENYFTAIAHANTALEAIENLGTPATLLPAKGDASLFRRGDMLMAAKGEIVQLYDIEGRFVMSGSLLDMSSLPHGVYIVRNADSSLKLLR